MSLASPNNKTITNSKVIQVFKQSMINVPSINWPLAISISFLGVGGSLKGVGSL